MAREPVKHASFSADGDPDERFVTGGGGSFKCVSEQVVTRFG